MSSIAGMLVTWLILRMPGCKTSMIKIPAHVQKMIWEATGINLENNERPEQQYYFFQIHQMEHFVRLMEAYYASDKQSTNSQ